MNKELQFFHIIMAFGHFAGKSGKVTGASKVLAHDTLNEMEHALRQIEVWCRQQDATEWPDLHKLADQIAEELNR